MRDRILEADWKVFRKIQPIALDRFCERTLAELQLIACDTSKSHHERYGDIYGLIQDRDKKLAAAFDGMSRSRMIEHLALMNSYGLLTDEEMASFGDETRQQVQTWKTIFRR
ncbi:MAG: peptide ABC transporter substrate-binding protein [Planctomycetota bacterium]|nr:peptide ABC transporter substrate-binding protein [Planctomycetota bacterium]MDA1212229.1 peptide ABC transporter substrate-binding protein [Planctomycetota bacterium]